MFPYIGLLTGCRTRRNYETDSCNGIHCFTRRGVIRSVGLGLSSGRRWSRRLGRDYSVVNAKLMALRGCERRGPIPICTIVWCRPGWQRGT
jgi:hypothetical protein